MIFIILMWRAYMLVAAIIFLNSVSMVVFNPTWGRFKRALLGMPLVLVWPIALFSKQGRAVLFNRSKEL